MLTDELESCRLWWLCRCSVPEVLLPPPLTVELPVLPLLSAVLVVVALSADPAEPAPLAVPALTRSCRHRPVDSADMASNPLSAPLTTPPPPLVRPPGPKAVAELVTTPTPRPPPPPQPPTAEERSMPRYVGKMVEKLCCWWWWWCSADCWCAGWAGCAGCSGGRWWSLPVNFVVTTSLKCCRKVVVLRPVSSNCGESKSKMQPLPEPEKLEKIRRGMSLKHCEKLGCISLIFLIRFTNYRFSSEMSLCAKVSHIGFIATQT